MTVQAKVILNFLIAFLFTLLLSSGRAQDIQLFETAAQNLVLLKNDSDLLPLADLQSHKIAMMNFGNEGEVFRKTAANYTHTGFKGTVSSLEGFMQMAKMFHWEKDFQGHDLLIVSVFSKAVKNDPQLTSLHDFFNWEILPAKKILVCFGPESAFANLPKADALIFSPMENGYAESLAMQLICGGATVRGKLQNDLPPFKTGDGLRIEKRTRLGYALPEAVGLDSKFLNEEIERIVLEGYAQGAYPGAQVLVAKNGQIVLHKAWGYQSSERTAPVGVDDIYDLASVTKVAAALPALMYFHSKGKLDLDAPLKRYYPKFRRSNKKDLTLRRLLTHTARLQAWIPFWKAAVKPDGSFKNKTFSADSSAKYPVPVTDKLFLYKNYRKKIFKTIKKSPLIDTAGYVYSDLSFYLYPEIIQDLSGQDFETFLKKEFYDPLGANTLTFNAYRHFDSTKIIPTEVDDAFRKTLLHGRVDDEGAAMLGGVSGHAGLFGSAADLAKIFQMYLNGGSYSGRQFISESTLKEFTAAPYKAEGVHRGVGFDKPLLVYDAVKSSAAKKASPATFGHSGFTGTLVWADPESQLLFIFLSNRVNPTRENRKLYDLNIRPRIHQAIYDAMKIND